MWPPAGIKDIHKLTGYLVVISRFISRLAEHSLPFFKLLQNSRPFIWTEEAKEVFHELKRYLTSSPIMVSLEHGEPLLLYIMVIADVVSMVLVMGPRAQRGGSQVLAPGALPSHRTPS
jgi:hypothetical protein